MASLANKFISLTRSCIVNKLNFIRPFSLGSFNLQQKSLQTIQSLEIDITKPKTPEHHSEVFQKINEQLKAQSEGRLFAVVQLCGKQFKITSGDVILVEGYWPPTCGDKISLDKVLLAGGNDFTLIGCPILKPGVCDVHATIIEKTLTHTKTHFRKKRRKQYMRINFQRSPHTMIRINSIDIHCVDDGQSEKDSNSEKTRIF